jgi:hypothetical protein
MSKTAISRLMTHLENFIVRTRKVNPSQFHMSLRRILLHLSLERRTLPDTVRILREWERDIGINQEEFDTGRIELLTAILLKNEGRMLELLYEADEFVSLVAVQSQDKDSMRIVEREMTKRGRKAEYTAAKSMATILMTEWNESE